MFFKHGHCIGNFKLIKNGSGSSLTGAVITNGGNGCYKMGQPLLLQLGAD